MEDPRRCLHKQLDVDIHDVVATCCVLHNICETRGETFDEDLMEGVESQRESPLQLTMLLNQQKLLQVFVMLSRCTSTSDKKLSIFLYVTLQLIIIATVALNKKLTYRNSILRCMLCYSTVYRTLYYICTDVVHEIHVGYHRSSSIMFSVLRVIIFILASKVVCPMVQCHHFHHSDVVLLISLLSPFFHFHFLDPAFLL